jgi:hypothetical protein
MEIFTVIAVGAPILAGAFVAYLTARGAEV